MTQNIKIPNNMNCMELFEICASNSPELLKKTLVGISTGSLVPQKQCESGVCYADKLSKEECRINWEKSAIEIHNLVRGVYRCPSAFFEYKGKIIKVLETEPIEGTSNSKIGEFISVTKSGIDVQTGNGILRLIRVKPEGKGEMLAKDWGNGLKN
jgi:methionyl-tRNA formyltransferase